MSDTFLPQLAIEYVSPESLKPNPHNSRRHPRKQRLALAASMRRFKYLVPALVDATGTIIAGHGRVEVAKEIGLETIPIIRIEHLSPDDLRAYVIADNKLAQLAGWDRDILAIELAHLVEIDATLPEIMGFDVGEAEVIIGEVAGGVDPDDAVIPPLSKVAVSRSGDIWTLGKHHRVGCGDARDETIVAELLAGRVADAVFVDPPWNVRVNGHVGGKGKVQHAEFAMASGEMTDEAFSTFLGNVGRVLRSVCRDGAIAFFCTDWRALGQFETALRPSFGKPLNLCVWRKSNAGMGSLYRSQHELVVVMKAGTAPHLNTVQLGRHGRNRTNVWDYASVNTFREDRQADLAWHPTVKPVPMVADAIKDVTRRGDLVLDTFLGSGTTLIAAERSGRRCRGLEIDPLYVDLALERWREATGIEPLLAGSGEPFSTVAQDRRAS